LRIVSLGIFFALAGCVHKTAPASASGPANPAAAKSPDAALSWADCIKIEGSKIEQTYPEICVAPDGRKAAQPR
jgi:hypothetical protein